MVTGYRCEGDRYMVTGEKCEGDRFFTFAPSYLSPLTLFRRKSMALAKTFEELRVWQDSRVLVVQIYSVFKFDSGQYRDYAFRDQIQRAAVSVMNNISEGFERGTKADFARFLDVAKGSCGELRSMTYIAEDLGYISPVQAADIRESSLKLTKGISALTKTLRNKQ